MRYFWGIFGVIVPEYRERQYLSCKRSHMPHALHMLLGTTTKKMVSSFPRKHALHMRQRNSFVHQGERVRLRLASRCDYHQSTHSQAQFVNKLTLQTLAHAPRFAHAPAQFFCSSTGAGAAPFGTAVFTPLIMLVPAPSEAN